MEQTFDRELFDRLVAAFRQGTLPETTGVVEDGSRPVPPGDIRALPAPGSPLYAACVELGGDILARAQVAAVVLAGGAGTRFGGQVKALVPVLRGKTFLDFKLQDVRSAGAGGAAQLPAALMTSNLTDRPIADHVERHWRGAPVFLFQQQVLPRIYPDGRIATEANSEPSMTPTGHGDFYRALKHSGLGDRLYDSGVRYLFFSNVDNLAATLDPAVIGYHASHRAEMTLEFTERKAPDGTLDEGGAPVRLHGQLVLKEKVKSADHALLSTNNFTFELRPLLDKSIDLPWRVIRRKVLSQDVLQFETVSGEATALLDEQGRPVLKTEFVRVPREDPADSRFEPIKLPEHLVRAVQRMRQRLEALADAMRQ